MAWEPLDRRAQLAERDAPASVGSRTTAATSSGKRRREAGDRADRTRAEAVEDQRLGADEDVEPFDQVRREALERRVRDLQAGEIGRPLAQRRAAPRSGRRSRSRARTRRRRRQSERRRPRRPRSGRAAPARRAGSTAGRSPRSRRLRRPAACSTSATVSAVVCAPQCAATCSRPADASTKSSSARRRSVASKSSPSPVVPRASTPSSPASTRKSTYGPNGVLVELVPGERRDCGGESTTEHERDSTCG